ncbi:type II secretion system protein [Tenacibaculum sp. 190524A02b]|uniref:Prepilin-type N-terminal cleavage/methylation domain-containing protein n=1 Tax=Tenacibaculum vairaonense TaxID=3137860 RepID=A0ABP1FF74_9FLAO
MKKVKAFTLSEVLVVMVISTIVVSIAFLVLSMTQKQMKLIQTNLEYKQDIQHLERVLWKDFNEAHLIEQKTKEVFVAIKQNDTVPYTILDNVVLRDKDSFFVAVKEKVFFFNGKETQKETIDAIKLFFDKTYTNKELFVYTNKDASFYLNQ